MPRSLTAFTVCLWMSSSNTRGTPFSYAVSGTDNELLIEYNRYFHFLIGGTKRYYKYVTQLMRELMLPKYNYSVVLLRYVYSDNTVFKACTIIRYTITELLRAL